MAKLVFIGAGSGFGAKSFVDLMSFEELRDGEVVLVDVNPHHLAPVERFCKNVVDHYDAPLTLSTADDWRDGVLDGADYVVTSFAQGGPAYSGYPFAHEIMIPQKYGIYQNVADTVGIGGVFRTLRTAPEMLAIAADLERRSPGARILNYVNPMSMLTRALSLASPKVETLGLCHNIQYTIRDIAAWIGVSHKELRYEAAGVNHMAWFLGLEYLNGQNAYPDLSRAGARSEIYNKRSVQFELLEHFGYFTTESSRHCSEYLPYFLPREADRAQVGLDIREVQVETGKTSKRWDDDSSLVRQANGVEPLDLQRSFEYGMHIVHALETDAVYRMNLNLQNTGLITNLPDSACVEVACTVDRNGVHPHYVGDLPVQLASLCRGLSDMQTLASDAVLERDLGKAYMACAIDPCTAASASPKTIKECFNELAEAEREWLEPYWGSALQI
jgi:alpha-galactosidase